MKKLFGALSLIFLILSTSMVVFLLFSPLFVLVLTPYLVMFSALTLSSTVVYFYQLNEVKSKAMNFFIYTVVLVPLIIPVAACLDADLMEKYWHQYLSLTLLQMGIGVLSATFFFKFPKINLATFLSVINAIVLFIIGILIVVKSSVLSSIPFLMTLAASISILFILAVVLRLREFS